MMDLRLKQKLGALSTLWKYLGSFSKSFQWHFWIVLLCDGNAASNKWHSSTSTTALTRILENLEHEQQLPQSEKKNNGRLSWKMFFILEVLGQLKAKCAVPTINLFFQDIGIFPRFSCRRKVCHHLHRYGCTVTFSSHSHPRTQC